MSKSAEIRQKLKDSLGFTPSYPFTAQVVSVEGNSCTVKLEGDLEISDVKLKATMNTDDNEVLFIPKIGSKVLLISLTNGLENLTALKFDELEKVQFKQGDLAITVDGSDNKVSVKNADTGLLQLFTDLKAIIEGITVSTGVGPSGTPLPPTIQKLTIFEQDFKKLLK